MDKIVIIGNLTRDPETKVTPNGKTVCEITVACNRMKDRPTVFYKVSAWEKTGEACQKYLRKGSKLYVEGEPNVHAWTGEDGKVKAQIQVTANKVEFLSAKGDDEQPATQAYVPVEAPDDLPF